MQLQEDSTKHIQQQLQKLQHNLAPKSIAPEANAFLLLTILSTKNGGNLQAKFASQLVKIVSKKWVETEDLGNIFWVLYALHKYNPSLIDGKYLAYAIRRLTNAEVDVGGPYGIKESIDPLTNAVIAMFLKNHDVSLPKTEKYLEEIFINKKDSKLTTSWLSFLYVAIPILMQINGEKLLSELNKIRPSDLKDSQQTAMYISILLKVEPKSKINTYIRRLFSQISGEGSKGTIFYFSLNNKSSESLLVNGLIIEALSYYISIHNENIKTDTASFLYKSILKQTRDTIEDLPSPINETGLKIWGEMLIADKNHEIGLIPQFFAETLSDCPKRLLSQCGRLGVANFYCWIATIIYDDFIDEEGEPALLPFANITHRLSLKIYRDLLSSSPEFYDYVEKVYQVVDQANSWEVANTRASINANTITITKLPNYGGLEILARRALGHAIGPILITMQLPNIKPIQANQIELAMQHYLIARQLNDDLHDWRKDLKAGQLSSVLTDLLIGIEIKLGTHDLEKLIPKLEEYFLDYGLNITIRKLLKHVTCSRQALKASKITNNTGNFITLLDNLQSSAEDSLSIVSNRQEFLRAYKEKSIMVK